MPAQNIAKLFCIIFSFGLNYSFAQKESSIWFLGAGAALDFSNTPPDPLPFGGVSITEAHPNMYSIISDANGKIVFFTDGHTVIRYQGTLLITVDNGDNLLGTGERQVIIPKPGTASQYYIFYMGISYSKKRQVMYCIVDVPANPAKMKVIEKNKPLYEGLHGYFTISAGCAGKSYWLVGEADRNKTEGTDKMFAFRIDSLGISDKIVSSPMNMTESGAYRFSPDGTKLVFHFSGNGSDGTALADFNRSTGIVSNPIILGPCCGWGEFSSSNRRLYVNYPDDSGVNLMQYDLSQTVLTGTTFATLPKEGTKLQIGLDERIYIILGDKDSINNLGVINNPNESGAAVNFEISKSFPTTYGITLVLPEFSTNYFYKSPYGKTNAGDDIEVCMGDKISIGTTNPSTQNYQWFPDQYLTNSKSDTTDFLFSGSTASSVTLKYILKGLGDECVKADTMTILIHPRPATPILGSRSVCPGVTSVEYSTVYDSNYAYDWTIEGGTIVSGMNTDSIKVDWGVTNPNAWVSVVVNNEFNCVGDRATFPVRVNAELDTQTPVGLEHVCENLLANNSYQIDNTNGSIYTWGILNGEIHQGQGSNKIELDWLLSGLHQLWVRERSTTKDTVCFGSSDTLNIKVYRDSLQVSIRSVSIHPEDDSKSTVLGSLANLPLNFSEPVTVLRKDKNESDWLDVAELDIPENLKLRFDDHDLQTHQSIYDYKLSTINGCQLEVSSNVHNTIRVEAEGQEKEGKIKLHWNPYVGWPENVLRYEVWRKIDSDTAFTLAGIADQPEVDLTDADKGFKHSLLIKAIAKDDTVYSWSNTVTVTFEHPLFIPNVFTPNGDSHNETFAIGHIELYPQNELVIYNRYGDEIHRAKSYNNMWNGEGLSSGIYYYSLRVFNAEKSFKGWIQIIR